MQREVEIVAKRSRIDSMKAALLLSKDILQQICIYQVGFHHDMLPLLKFKHDRTLRLACDANDHEQFDRVFSPWLAEFGLERIQLLVVLMPYLRRPIFLHALYYGKMVLLHYLHKNIDLGSVEYCEYFTKTNASCTRTVHDLLRIPAMRGHLEAVAFLYEYGYARSSFSAVERAANRGYFDIVKYLYQHDVEFDPVVIIEGAALHNHVGIAQYIYERFPHSILPAKLLIKVARKGHVATVKYLLSIPVIFDSALAEAALKGHLEVVKILLTTGSIDDAIESARQGGHSNIIEYLQEWKKMNEPNDDGLQQPLKETN